MLVRTWRRLIEQVYWLINGKNNLLLVPSGSGPTSMLVPDVSTLYLRHETLSPGLIVKVIGPFGSTMPVGRPATSQAKSPGLHGAPGVCSLNT